MGQVTEDLEKVKKYVDGKIADLENGDYAHISAGYVRYNNFDQLIENHAHKIVSKLTSLGYAHTTNHGFGCKDWKFYKEIAL